jgi:hypothetical protein
MYPDESRFANPARQQREGTPGLPSQFIPDRLQTITNGRYLPYDVDAVAIPIHHPRQAVHFIVDRTQVF